MIKKIKKFTIKAMIDNNCLFCDKNALNGEDLKERNYFVSQTDDSYQDYDRETNIDKKIFFARNAKNVIIY